MGSFDYVNVIINCPNCGQLVTEFQSQSARCDQHLIDPVKVDNFYNNCGYCDSWINFDRSQITNSIPSLLSNKPTRAEPYNFDEITELGFILTVIEEDEDESS